MVRMLSFSAYFLLKNPLKVDFFAVTTVVVFAGVASTGAFFSGASTTSDVSTVVSSTVTSSTGVSTCSSVLVISASDTGVSTVFAAVFGLVVLFLLDLLDDFGFFVAIIPPFNDIRYIIA